MPDTVDKAQGLIERLNEAALDARPRFSESVPSAANCCDCGEAIPPMRRDAVPGVQYCVYCAAEKAIRKNMFMFWEIEDDGF